MPFHLSSERPEKCGINFILNNNSDDVEQQHDDHDRPKQKATVRYLADEIASFGTPSSTDSKKTERLLDRISKCLDRGRHPTTPEAEARTSLSMAANLMAQHNLTEAEASSHTEGRPTRSGGDSMVTITHIENKEVGKHDFFMSLANAMNHFFDCKSYFYDQPGMLNITFYGLASNTAAAALAFEMCYNLILSWAIRLPEPKAWESYCLGIADGLHGSALQAKNDRAASMALAGLDGSNVADEWLKQQGYVVREAKPGGSLERDWGAYEEGRSDSKKIDVRGKRLD